MSKRLPPKSHFVFLDLSGRRWKRFRGLVWALCLLLSIAGALLCLTVAILPQSPAQLHSGLAARKLIIPVIESREEAAGRFLARKAAVKLDKQIAVEQAALRRKRQLDAGKPNSTVIGFYISDPSAYTRLAAHIDALAYIMPQWLVLNPDGASFKDYFSTANKDQLMVSIAAKHKVGIVPMLFNYGANGFEWPRLRNLLSSPSKQHLLAATLKDYLLKNNYAGLNVDLELDYGVPDSDMAAQRKSIRSEMPGFIRELKNEFAGTRLLVCQDVPPGEQAFDYAKLGELNDFVVVMFYDQHTGDGEPGPIAGQDWLEQESNDVFKLLDPAKTIIGLANFCADWPIRILPNGDFKSIGKGTNPSLAGAIQLAREAEAQIDMDGDELNPFFTYTDATTGQDHVVYMLDAVTAYNQVMALRGYEPMGAAVWRVGSEDPAIWTFFAEGRLGKPIKPAVLARVSYLSEVVDDPQDRGEIQEITSLPQAGYRKFTTDEDGLIVSEKYERYPSPYIMSLFGGQDKKVIALTFDDGPDPENTPKILEILKEYHAPATFFVVGQSAQSRPDILADEWRQGCDIGNHTFTHPHLAAVSSLRCELELNATQRLIESVTGASTRLFRPPFGEGADSNSGSSEDVALMHRVQMLGYVTVGMNIDPKDYTQPGPQTIVDRVIAALPENNPKVTESRNVILLHDGGGDRTDTIQALPRLIKALRQKGYRLVRVSDLLGPQGHAKMFPRPTPRQSAIAGLDRIGFESSLAFGNLIRVLFVTSIILGLARIVIIAPLAVVQNRRARRIQAADFTPPVTVIIPSYNEDRVIQKTVANILNSDYPKLHAIVVDDGSTDDTETVMRRVFGKDPRVTYVRKDNGGKATALNVGYEMAKTDIVVCIDADTMLARDAIRKLVAPLADKRVGAVAGNVKVGNRLNPLTLWQSLEYITSQNFDRRAYAALKSVPIIPGAIGAWRKSAVEKAGLCETSTLAEDCDLTFKVRMLGYQTVCANDALAYTEAPEDLRSLAKQRFRWAFGVLQVLWKHKGQLFRPRYGGFGMLVMPAMWLFNVFFQALAPMVDVAVILAAFTGQFWVVVTYGAVLFAADLVASLTAYLLDDENPRELVWLFWQRFFYRQFMYYVVIKSIVAAVRGGLVGWGKLQRRATTAMPTE